MALLRKQRPKLLVEGPIQYDAAVDPEVARVKIKVGMLQLENFRQLPPARFVCWASCTGATRAARRVRRPAHLRPVAGAADGAQLRMLGNTLVGFLRSQLAEHTEQYRASCSGSAVLSLPQTCGRCVLPPFRSGRRSGADICTFLLLGETCTCLSLRPIDVSAQGASEVAGRANVLIFPDLNTGNNTYKVWHRVLHTGTLLCAAVRTSGHLLCGAVSLCTAHSCATAAGSDNVLGAGYVSPA